MSETYASGTYESQAFRSLIPVLEVGNARCHHARNIPSWCFSDHISLNFPLSLVIFQVNVLFSRHFHVRLLSVVWIVSYLHVDYNIMKAKLHVRLNKLNIQSFLHNECVTLHELTNGC